jgi:hypothetical protein
MLKHVLAASAAVVALVAISTPSFAAGNTETVLISGTVTAKCAVANSSISVALTLDSADGTYAGESLTPNLGDIWCNGTGNSVAITATPVTTGNTTADPSFTNRVDYTLSTDAASVFSGFGTHPITPLSTTAAPLTGATETLTGLPAFDSGASHSTFTMATTASGGKKLIAGSYTGSITVLVTPGT